MEGSKFLQTESYRAKAYNLFTYLFCQPDEEADFKGALQQLKEVFEHLGGNPAKKKIDLALQGIEKYTQTELLVEYTRLFLGPFKVLAPPYSSIYFGAKQLMNEDTVWVSQFYQKAGLQFDKELKDLPDHFAVESEFVYYLIYNEVNSFNEGDAEKGKSYYAMQHEFLNKHYNKWVPKFCDQIIKQTTNTFYINLAESLKHAVLEFGIPTLEE